VAADHASEGVLSDFTRMHLPGRMRHGYGKIKYECGNLYVGQWERDVRAGVGRYVYACWDVYDGQWKDGMYHGRGKYSSPGGGGDEYEGQWQHDKPHGHGRYLYRESGDSYEGQFQEGLFHGVGRYALADGGTKDGVWREGLLVPIWQREAQDAPSALSNIARA